MKTVIEKFDSNKLKKEKSYFEIYDKKTEKKKKIIWDIETEKQKELKYKIKSVVDERLKVYDFVSNMYDFRNYSAFLQHEFLNKFNEYDEEKIFQINEFYLYAKTPYNIQNSDLRLIISLFDLDNKNKRKYSEFLINQITYLFLSNYDLSNEIAYFIGLSYYLKENNSTELKNLIFIKVLNKYNLPFILMEKIAKQVCELNLENYLEKDFENTYVLNNEIVEILNIIYINIIDFDLNSWDTKYFEFINNSKLRKIVKTKSEQKLVQFYLWNFEKEFDFDELLILLGSKQRFLKSNLEKFTDEGFLLLNNLKYCINLNWMEN